MVLLVLVLVEEVVEGEGEVEGDALLLAAVLVVTSVVSSSSGSLTSKWWREVWCRPMENSSARS